MSEPGTPLPHKPARRRWTFGLKTLLVLVTLAAMVLGYVKYVQHAREQRRVLGASLIDLILVQQHWHGLEAAHQISSDAWDPSRLTTDLVSGKQQRWEFFHPGKGIAPGQSNDPFAAAMLNDLPPNIAPGGPAAAPNVESADHEASDGQRYYYQAVRATQASCVTCHRVVGKNPDPTLAMGDLHGVMRVELPN